LAKSHGYIGVSFRYANSNNFFSLEISGQVVKHCQIRKVTNGNYRIIDKVEDKCGYDLNKWYSITI